MLVDRNGNVSKSYPDWQARQEIADGFREYNQICFAEAQAQAIAQESIRRELVDLVDPSDLESVTGLVYRRLVDLESARVNYVQSHGSQDFGRILDRRAELIETLEINGLLTLQMARIARVDNRELDPFGKLDDPTITRFYPAQTVYSETSPTEAQAQAGQPETGAEGSDSDQPDPYVATLEIMIAESETNLATIEAQIAIMSDHVASLSAGLLRAQERLTGLVNLKIAEAQKLRTARGLLIDSGSLRL